MKNVCHKTGAGCVAENRGRKKQSGKSLPVRQMPSHGLPVRWGSIPDDSSIAWQTVSSLASSSPAEPVDVLGTKCRSIPETGTTGPPADAHCLVLPTTGSRRCSRPVPEHLPENHCRHYKNRLARKNNKKYHEHKEKQMKYLIMTVFLLSGCVAPPEPLATRNSGLTQGNVQMNLVTGETSKDQVLEVFGSPNITTRDGAGREVWTYQRAAQVNQSSSQSGGWTVILAGKSRQASGFESSSRMTTLIIKFDPNDIVVDFKSRTSTF